MFLTICPGQNVGLTKLYFQEAALEVFSLMSSSLFPPSQEKNKATLYITVIKQSHTAVPYQLMGKYSLYLVNFFNYYSFYQSNLRLLLISNLRQCHRFNPNKKKALI